MLVEERASVHKGDLIAELDTDEQRAAVAEAAARLSEIDADIRGAHFNLRNVPERVAQQRKDPWQGYWDAKQVLTKAIIKDMASK